MILYFLRHASAGQSLSNPKKDEKRGLDKDGVEQCGYVGRALAAMDVQVDAMLSSPLKRAAQTASLVGNELSYEGKLQLEDALAPGRLVRGFPPPARQVRQARVHHGRGAQSQSQRISWAASSAKPDARPRSISRKARWPKWNWVAIRQRCNGASHPRSCARFTPRPQRVPGRRSRGSSFSLFPPPTVPGPRWPGAWAAS